MGKPRSSSQTKVAEKLLVREVQTTPQTGAHNFLCAGVLLLIGCFRAIGCYLSGHTLTYDWRR